MILSRIVASDILKDKPWWLRIPGKAVMRAIGKSPSQGLVLNGASFACSSLLGAVS